ncbi:MAG: type II toxin-antitoxin system RelE/ParE family toxin [Microscillaceae bacterium]|nr:type II toxin-antitoxin system RelE/ParE family toxin [Microscillaceae bacterium]
MIKVSWTKQAIQDLYQIREYYLKVSPKYADQLTDKFFDKVMLLENFPMHGRKVPEFNQENIRELVYKNFRLIYKLVNEKRMDIIAIHNSFTPLSDESILD